MSNFWLSGTGQIPSGNPEDSFVSLFQIIPEGTVATAQIKSFITVERENKYSGTTDKFYEINYKLLDGEFKSREVSQKIKCFNGTPEQIQRHLSMLKLIMMLCDYKPTKTTAPDDNDLLSTLNKIVCIKIGQWSMPKKDGVGFSEGNFVREVHPSGSIQIETGVKTVVEHKPTTGVESALTRNSWVQNLESDLPF